ncbi:MAG: hypothetical protein U1F65_00035 [Verrucomicrobiota bacterium]
MEELVNGLHNDNFNAGDRAFGIALDAIQPGKKNTSLAFCQSHLLGASGRFGQDWYKNQALFIYTQRQEPIFQQNEK